MQTMEFQIGVFVLALLAVSLGLWINVIWRWNQFGWPLPFRLRRAVPWWPIEAVIVIVIILFVVAAGLQQIFVGGAEKPGILSDPGQTLRLVQVQCISQAAELLLIPLVLSLWHLCYWADFGIVRREWTVDLRAALWGVLLAQLPVMLLKWPLDSLRKQSPHPLIGLLENSIDDRLILVWIAVQVVILAPLIEELLFRVILQGALSRESPPYLAILLSSAAFVGIHQPIDWAPLLPLALILGYVYYRRQSYLAVVLLHGLFNGISLIMAIISFSPPVPNP
ncbi:MAG: amino terminal protease self-immunity [Planctomycetaceae bacterium]|nr:amino terminal protease self-immunity [Planctomycetaceae bacterium]